MGVMDLQWERAKGDLLDAEFRVCQQVFCSFYLFTNSAQDHIAPNENPADGIREQIEELRRGPLRWAKCTMYGRACAERRS